MALKVAHVYTNYTAFSHPYLRAFSEELGSAGIDVRLFSRTETGESAGRCIPLRMFGRGRRLRSDLLAAWRNSPKFFQSISGRMGGRPKGLRRATRQWCDLLPMWEEAWDIVHIMNWPLYRLLATYLEDTKTKFVLSFRGYEILYGMEENEEWRQDVCEVWEKASALHCVSEFLAEKAIEKGAPAGKVKVIRPGVDVRFFHPGGCRREKETCHVATVCRLTWEKGLELGLMVARKLRIRGVPVVYHVIGDGPSRTALRCWADRLNLGDAIYWHGALAIEDVRTVLSDCDVYLHPSASESFGVAVVEAMAMGIPVVATRVEGIPEIVEHDKTGYLLEFGDIEGMAEAIERVWMTADLRQQMGTEARQQAIEKFSIEREVKEWVELYSSVSSQD